LRQALAIVIVFFTILSFNSCSNKNQTSIKNNKLSSLLKDKKVAQSKIKLKKLGKKNRAYKSLLDDSKQSHISSFEIAIGETAESIFKKMAIISKKVYVIKNGKEFISNISTNNIKNEDDIKLYFKVQGFRLNIKHNDKYAIVNIKKIEDRAYKILKKIKVQIKGYAPFNIVFNELIKNTGIIYNPNDLGKLASVPTNFYFSGNLADCLVYATNLIGVNIEFDGMNLIHSKMKTVLLDFEFPVRDTSLTTSISSSGGGSSVSTDSGGSSSTSSLVSIFKSNISKKITDLLKNLKSKEGGFSYISELGQISITDYPKNIRTITKVINNLNDKFKEQIKIEFKFYKFTTSIIQDRGIDLSGKINKYIKYGVRKGTLNVSNSNPNFTLDANDGTSSAILNFLNTYGKAQIAYSLSYITNNNQLFVEKVASNRGYISKISKSETEKSTNATSEMTPASVSDGSFIATYPRTMSGDKISLQLFLTINDLKQFVNRTSGGNTIQTPDTDEQSHFNTITLQNNVPYIINYYEVESKSNKKSAIPGFEDYSWTDFMTSDKHNTKDKTYIITEVKVSRGY
jgi:hypothetical protein